MSWRYHLAICQFKSGHTLIAYSNMIDIIPAISGRDDIYAWLIQAHAVLYRAQILAQSQAALHPTSNEF